MYILHFQPLFPAAIVLPYPARNLGAEIVLLFFLALIDAVRIFLGIYMCDVCMYECHSYHK